jgi:hypothetical protein
MSIKIFTEKQIKILSNNLYLGGNELTHQPNDGVNHIKKGVPLV